MKEKLPQYSQSNPQIKSTSFEQNFSINLANELDSSLKPMSKINAFQKLNIYYSAINTDNVFGIIFSNFFISIHSNLLSFKSMRGKSSNFLHHSEKSYIFLVLILSY